MTIKVDKFTFFFFFSSDKEHEIFKRDAEEEEKLKIVGFRIEKSDKEPEIDDEGIPILRADTIAKLRLFGSGFLGTTLIGLDQKNSEAGTACNNMVNIGYFEISPESSTNALVEIKLPKTSLDLYLCATNDGIVSRFSEIKMLIDTVIKF